MNNPVLDINGNPIEKKSDTKVKPVKVSDFRIRAEVLELELATLCAAMTQYAENLGQPVKVVYRRFNSPETHTIRGVVELTEQGTTTTIVQREVKEEDKAKAISGYYRHMMVSGMFYDMFTAGVVYIKAEMVQRASVRQAFDMDIDKMESDNLINYVHQVHPSHAENFGLSLYIKEGNWDKDKLTALNISDLRGVCKVIKGKIVNGNPQEPTV